MSPNADAPVMLDATHAPWTPEQVAKLNEFQACGRVHPFTCCAHVTMRAEAHGFVCPSCGGVQTWAHRFMLNGAPPDPFAAFRGVSP